jgi:hypothetical protein
MLIHISLCSAVLVSLFSWPDSNCAIMRVSRHFCGGIVDWTNQQRRCMSRRAASVRHFFSAAKGALGVGSQWGDRLPRCSSLVCTQLCFFFVLFSDTALVTRRLYPL